MEQIKNSITIHKNEYNDSMEEESFEVELDNED